MSDRTEEGEGALRLTLYVAGRTPRADRTVDELQAVVADELDVAVTVSIVDVLERPDLAEESLILATPTLVRESPRPARRLIGDMTDTRSVLEALGVIAAPDPRPQPPTGDGDT
ncbi:circadian clock KaiB family protein [Euzebya sp.]|uniref:circadian clock KaiB family protein n=1 Tax=Euzebya sp. TaxID=1971409 RepID=UPI003513E297